MKIIVGLGNKGKEYEGTRHNAGFMFLDAIAECPDFITSIGKPEFHLEKKFEAEIAETTAKGDKIILVKPQTYMNASGRAVSKILAYYKAKIEDLIVINDDIDLPIGTIRVRKEGSSGGQKGLENIIREIGSNNFVRFRVGISNTGEKVDKIETVNYVLGKFSGRELPIVNNVLLAGINYLLEYIGTHKEMPAHTIDITGKENRE